MNTAADILNALHLAHPKDKGWVFFGEYRNGSGLGGDREQRFDALAFNAWPSFKEAPFLRRAFEIKVSESDLRQELKDPDKRWAAKSVAHQFIWAAPVGLIKPSQIARDEGLWEWDGQTLTVKRTPHTRETMPPKWSFVASLMRRMCKLQ